MSDLLFGKRVGNRQYYRKPPIEVDVDSLKKCSVCGIDKPLTEFHRFKHARDGRTAACKVCRIAVNQRYRDTHREHIHAIKRQHYAANQEKYKGWRDAWKERNPERSRYLIRRSHLRLTYGITPEQYEALFNAQNGCCALCDRRPNHLLHVDHDHSCCPGKRSCGQCIRGLLCGSCNRLLGWFDNHHAEINAYLGGSRANY